MTGNASKSDLTYLNKLVYQFNNTFCLSSYAPKKDLEHAKALIYLI